MKRICAIVETGPCHYELLPSLLYYWDKVARITDNYTVHLYVNPGAIRQKIDRFFPEEHQVAVHSIEVDQVLESVSSADEVFIASPLYNKINPFRLLSDFENVNVVYAFVHNVDDWHFLKECAGNISSRYGGKIIFCFLFPFLAAYYGPKVDELMRSLSLRNPRISSHCLVLHNYYINIRSLNVIEPISGFDSSSHLCIQGNLEIGRRDLDGVERKISCSAYKPKLCIIGASFDQSRSAKAINSITSLCPGSIVYSFKHRIPYTAYYSIAKSCMGLVPCFGSAQYLSSMASSTIGMSVSLAMPLVEDDLISSKHDAQIPAIYGIPLYNSMVLSLKQNREKAVQTVIAIRRSGLATSLASLLELLYRVAENK